MVSHFFLVPTTLYPIVKADTFAFWLIVSILLDKNTMWEYIYVKALKEIESLIWNFN